MAKDKRNQLLISSTIIYYFSADCSSILTNKPQNISKPKSFEYAFVYPTIVPSPSPSPAPSPSPTPSGEQIVVIDAGHGGHDPGAVYMDVKEKDINLDMALKLEELLNSAGIKTYMIRKEDVYVSLRDRTDFANNLNATLFFSIHNNAFNKSANGTETLYNPNIDYDGNLTGKEFATIIQEELVSKLGTRNRRIVKRPELAVLKWTNMPAVLAEIAFITNDNDRELLKKETFRQDAAEAMKDGIIKALNELK